MASETCMKLPLLNLSNLKKESSTWESLKNQVRSALEEYGCFQATFDEIPVQLRESVLHGVKQVFDLPLEIKLRTRSSKPYKGYIGQRALFPLHESLAIEDVLLPGKVDNFINLLWAEGHPNFSKNIKSFAEQLAELDKTVRKMILENYGLETYVDEHMESTYYLLRLHKYDGPRSNETQRGLPSHTDKNIITILWQNEVTGFQVLTKDGQWINVEPTVNSFIVMAADSFHAWTNGRVHSPYHRVMMTGDEARYSIILFSVPKTGCVIQAPKEMVDEEHPLLFKAYDYQKFLEFLRAHSDARTRRSPAALKEYCGN